MALFDPPEHDSLLAGRDGSVSPPRGSGNVGIVVGTVWVHLVLTVGSQGARVAEPTTPMNLEISCQVEPEASSAPVLVLSQFESTMTAPFDDSTVSLLPAKVRAPHFEGSRATSP